ncbi:MAG: MFS transporter [Gemmatimonadetes bacterium]|nr:MFS transporter [Gemmatimonadota bacterium]
MNIRSIPLRLSIMFGLAQMSEGAVLVLLSGHMGALGFSGQQISYVFASTALAALVSPLIAGWLADRYWAPQHFLAGCQLVSAPILFAAWLQTGFVGFWVTMILFALIRLPSMTLTNVIAFYHLGRSEGFGFVRVWGTVGWIAVSWALSLYLRLWEGWDPATSHMGDSLLVAAVLFVVAGFYSFTLPHTPPGGGNGSKRPYAFLSAFRLLRQRNFAVIVAISFVSAVVSPFFYNFSFLFLTAPRALALAPSVANWVQSLGQVVEVIVLLALASSLRRLGLKRILLMGIGAQTIRMAAFAVGGPIWLVAGSMAMHGFIFTFFFIGLVIAVEELSEPEYRASAQGLLTFARGGIGALCGNFMAGRIYDRCALPEGGHNWTPIFAIPAVVTFLSLLFFALFFRDKRKEPQKDELPNSHQR